MHNNFLTLASIAHMTHVGGGGYQLWHFMCLYIGLTPS